MPARRQRLEEGKDKVWNFATGQREARALRQLPVRETVQKSGVVNEQQIADHKRKLEAEYTDCELDSDDEAEPPNRRARSPPALHIVKRPRQSFQDMAKANPELMEKVTELLCSGCLKKITAALKAS